MLTEEYVNREFIPLRPSEQISDVLETMKSDAVVSLPVVEPTTGKLIGQVTLSQLEEAEDKGAAISSIRFENAPSLYPHQHIFEAARSMLIHEAAYLPVVDANQSWIGILEKCQTVEALTGLLNVTVQGSVLEVEVAAQDYHLGELVQLIEMEQARILGVAVQTPTHVQDPFLISFKLNVQDTSAISQSLRRHGYLIRSESDSELLNVDISERADELMRYLDV